MSQALLHSSMAKRIAEQQDIANQLEIPDCGCFRGRKPELICHKLGICKCPPVRVVHADRKAARLRGDKVPKLGKSPRRFCVHCQRKCDCVIAIPEPCEHIKQAGTVPCSRCNETGKLADGSECPDCPDSHGKGTGRRLIFNFAETVEYLNGVDEAREPLLRLYEEPPPPKKPPTILRRKARVRMLEERAARDSRGHRTAESRALWHDGDLKPTQVPDVGREASNGINGARLLEEPLLIDHADKSGLSRPCAWCKAGKLSSGRTCLICQGTGREARTLTVWMKSRMKDGETFPRLYREPPNERPGAKADSARQSRGA